MKGWNEILRQISMISQLGLSFMAPILICIGICCWMCNRFELGGWIFIPGFFFGLGGSFSVVYKYYKKVVGDTKKNTKKTSISFNSHI